MRRELDTRLAQDPAQLTGDDGLRLLGQVVDLATDLRDTPALERALDIARTVKGKLSGPKGTAAFHFCLGLLWDELRRLRRTADGASHEWKQPELEEANRAFRAAHAGGGFARLHPHMQCQVLTNIGNHFDRVGRFVEAVDFWDRALAVDPRFGMAIGNRGIGLSNYARHLFFRGHRAAFLRAARTALLDAVERPLEGNAVAGFRETLSHIDRLFRGQPPTGEPRFREYPLGRTKAERSYRLTCLRRRLFLNPLNDLGQYTAGARDVLTLPAMTMGINEGPRFQGLFNQLKQEYVSARYLYVEGASEPRRAHYSDRDVLLFDTLDYPVYGLAAEELKLAFRMSYSVLDKVAFFVNEYLGLGIAERGVQFRTIWFEKPDGKKGILRPEFRDRRNLPLRGLYWLSLDLADPAQDLREALEPDARDLAEIRNHLEHKYLKLHSLGFHGENHKQANEPLADTLSFSINRLAFEEKCLKMVKLARAAIMYLAFAVRVEEFRRAKERGEAGTAAVQMPFLDFPDEWKR
jgi:tetratricopeptide (TPR) repeat protein